MKRIAAVLLCVMIICIISGCGGEYEPMSESDRPDGVWWEDEWGEELEEIDMDALEELYSIRITAEDTVLEGVLYDTPTSRDFADMLPLTVKLWHPAPDFARAFDLPKHIPRYAKAGYEYELGALAYWYDGPSIALIYKASRDQTVVPVVPIGKVTSDVSVFEEYGGTITIELEEEHSGAKPEEGR